MVLPLREIQSIMGKPPFPIGSAADLFAQYDSLYRYLFRSTAATARRRNPAKPRPGGAVARASFQCEEGSSQ
jgi:hypothetical protein